MQDKKIAIGGCGVGWMYNATWPFAKLYASASSLTIKVSLFGTFTFTPEQIVSLETYSFIPLIGRGLRINHVNFKYPQRFIFWTLGNPDKVIKKLYEAGFTPSGTPSDISYADWTDLFDDHKSIPAFFTFYGLWIIFFILTVYLASR